MTAEHRPASSRITDALLPGGPPPGAAPAPNPAPAPAPLPAATTVPAATTAPIPAAPAAPVRTPAPLPAPPTGPTAPAGRTTAPAAGSPAGRVPARPAPAPAPLPPAVETTTRLRAIRATDPDPRRAPGSGPAGDAPAATVPRPAAPPRPVSAPAGPAPVIPPRPASVPLRPEVSGPARTYGLGVPGALPPEAPVETTTRLRPVRERRTGRTVAVAACAVLGTGLIGGALAGVWLAATEPGAPVEPVGYAEAKELWHNAPVDTLFPRTVAGPGAGPGTAARTWTRVVVAPDAACSPAALGKGLLAAVKPLGCERVLRATYTDATSSSVLTVGLVFTRADVTAQGRLGRDVAGRLGGQDVPPALSGPGTVAARFGAAQRASWFLTAPADLPVVVTAVSGFADGRTVETPLPADQAVGPGRTDAVAQSGLGHEARGIAKRFASLLRTSAVTAAKENDR
ncbi:hypothetical protein [Streptomyces sp. NPDC059491]|uniref:hypothetical protein n=1 Tax=Streptomyces sp. NPDC059491 TaxID=3346850 RepID=UPI0036BCB883